jgi:hypothetical protein
MRFTADGTYAWDPDGGLFGGDQAAWGHLSDPGGGSWS